MDFFTHFRGGSMIHKHWGCSRGSIYLWDILSIWTD